MIRLGVSMEEELLHRLEAVIAESPERDLTVTAVQSDEEEW